MVGVDAWQFTAADLLAAFKAVLARFVTSVVGVGGILPANVSVLSVEDFTSSTACQTQVCERACASV